MRDARSEVARPSKFQPVSYSQSEKKNEDTADLKKKHPTFCDTPRSGSRRKTSQMSPPNNVLMLGIIFPESGGKNQKVTRELVRIVAEIYSGKKWPGVL